MRPQVLAEAKQDHSPRTSPAERRTPLPILVVDDDPVGCRATAAILEDAGYAVEWTTEPARALARAQRWPYALVVSDVQMPGLRGTALAAELARTRPATKVLLLSALVDERTKAEAAALAVPLLEKPVRLANLLATVARLTAPC
jgi:CheY-like chemotaxis protein